MSNTYEVHIVETLEKVVSVDAESIRDALQKAEESWKNGDYILDADDFKDVDIFTASIIPEAETTKFYLADGVTETDNPKTAAVAICTTAMSWGGMEQVQSLGKCKLISGIKNTELAIANLGTETGTIWEYCRDMREATGDDSWYVPAIEELRKVYNFPRECPADNVWSSSEYSALPAYRAFGFGAHGCTNDYSKSYNFCVILFRGSKRRQLMQKTIDS